MIHKKIIVVVTLILLLAPGFSHAAPKKLTLAEQRVVNMTDYDKSSLGSVRIQPPEGWVFSSDRRDISITSPDEKATIMIQVQAVSSPSRNLQAELAKIKVGQTVDGETLLEKGTMKLKAGLALFFVLKQEKSSGTEDESYGTFIIFKKSGVEYWAKLTTADNKNWAVYRDTMEKSIKTLHVSPKTTKIPPLKITTKLAPVFTSNPEISGFKASIKPPLGWRSKELTKDDYIRNGGFGFSFGIEADYAQFSIELEESDPVLANERFASVRANTTIAGVPGLMTKEYISEENNNSKDAFKQSIYFLKDGALYVVEIQGTQKNWKKYKAVVEKSLKTLKVSS